MRKLEGDVMIYTFIMSALFGFVGGYIIGIIKKNIKTNMNKKGIDDNIPSDN